MTLEVVKNASTAINLIELGNGSAIDDVFATDDTEKPISGGIFTVKKAEKEFVYLYKYHELKVSSGRRWC